MKNKNYRLLSKTFLVPIILTLSGLNLFKEIKNKNLKNITKQVKSKSIYCSCQYRKQLNSIGKDPNYDLITLN